MSKFGDAFKAARAAGKKEFSFGGKSYHTRTKDEENQTNAAAKAKSTTAKVTAGLSKKLSNDMRPPSKVVVTAKPKLMNATVAAKGKISPAVVTATRKTATAPSLGRTLARRNKPAPAKTVAGRQAKTIPGRTRNT